MFRSKIFHTHELKNGLFKTNATRRIPELKLNEPAWYQIVGDIVEAKIGSSTYSVIEPTLSEEENRILKLIKNGLYEIINIDHFQKSEEYIEKSTRVIISELDLRLSEESMKKILFNIYKDLVGFGKIEAILNDPFISSLRFEKGNLNAQHRLYGTLRVDFVFTEEEIINLSRKLALHCEQDLPKENAELHCKEEGWEIYLYYKPQQIMSTSFIIQRQFRKFLSPIELIQQRRASPELFAFLWMAMGDKNHIFFVNNIEFVNAMSYFLPKHSKVLTNIKDYNPNLSTETYLGEIFGEEDFALIENYSGIEINGTGVVSMPNVDPRNNIVCFIENGIIKSVKEDGKEIFGFYNNKFLYNLDSSVYIRSRGNKAILENEFTTRVKLLTILTKNNTKREDFIKIINIYKENPDLILRRAGLA
jgi:hypothetical protein